MSKSPLATAIETARAQAASMDSRAARYTATGTAVQNCLATELGQTATALRAAAGWASANAYPQAVRAANYAADLAASYGFPTARTVAADLLAQVAGAANAAANVEAVATAATAAYERSRVR